MSARPTPVFRAKIAFGPYVKGALLSPVGLYRDVLLRRGLIEKVEDPPAPPARPIPALLQAPRQASAPENREIKQGELEDRSRRPRGRPRAIATADDGGAS